MLMKPSLSIMVVFSSVISYLLAPKVVEYNWTMIFLLFAGGMLVTGSANAINVVGIESPGLSAAPAIAELVRSMFEEMAGELKPNPSFNPVRPTPVRFDVLDNEQRRRLIEKDKAYGRIICRCESVTEGEILDAIRAPAGAVDVDGVKRRTRAGMGRCQGGFCGSKVVEILARELGVEIDQITKFGGGSLILSGKSK